MPNSTWLELTNQALHYAGLDEIDSEDDFNNGSITKYQDQTKWFIDLGHRMLTPGMTRYFLETRVELPLNAGTDTYELDTGISPENISLRTFFIISTDPLLVAQNCELRNWKYEDYKKQIPDPSKVPQGPPVRWILLPIERTDGSQVHRVKIYPTPDQDYRAEYQAKLNAYTLTEAKSITCWPKEYEHCLTSLAWALTEGALGEGKGANAEALATKAVKQVKLASGRPEDIRKTAQMMRMPRRRRGWYNSPQSVDPATGTVFD